MLGAVLSSERSPCCSASTNAERVDLLMKSYADEGWSRNHSFYTWLSVRNRRTLCKIGVPWPDWGCWEHLGSSPSLEDGWTTHPTRNIGRFRDPCSLRTLSRRGWVAFWYGPTMTCPCWWRTSPKTFRDSCGDEQRDGCGSSRSRRLSLPATC